MTHVVLAFLAEVAVKSTLLIVLAAVAAWIVRRQPAAVRHRIWCSALAGAAALPLVMLLVPRLGVPLLPANPVAGPSTEADRTERTDRRHELTELAPIAEARREPAPLPLEAALVLLYATGAVASAAGLFVSLRRLRCVARLAGPAAARETLALEFVASVLGIAPPSLRVARGGGPAVPMTWGARRPVLLLPESAEQWPEAYLRSALAHEAAHIRRGDWAVQLAVRAICVFYWFHPLARWAAARLRTEAERACDDLALLSGIHAADYAACLLEVTRMNREDRPDRHFALAALPMAQSTALAERLRAVLDTEAKRQERRRGAGVVISVAALAAVLLTGAIQATPARPAAGRSSDMAMALAMIQGRGTVQFVPKSKASLLSQVSALRARLKAAESEVRRLRALESKPAGAAYYRLKVDGGAGDPGITGKITIEEEQKADLEQAEANRALAAAALAQAKAQERAAEAEREKARLLADAQRARAAAGKTRAEGSLEEKARESEANARAQEIIRRKAAKDQEVFNRADRDARIDELVRRGYLADRDAKRRADENARKAERIKVLEGGGNPSALPSRGGSGAGAPGGSFGSSSSDGRGLPGLGGGSGLGSDALGGGPSGGAPGLGGSGTGGRSGGADSGGRSVGRGGGSPLGGSGLPGGADSVGRASNGTPPRGGSMPGMSGSGGMAPAGGSPYGSGGGRSAQNATARNYDEELDDLQDQVQHIDLDIQFAKRRFERAQERAKAGISSVEEADDAELKLQHLALDRDAVVRRIKRLEENRARRMRGGGAAR